MKKFPFQNTILWGKVIGGILGFIFYGSPGLILGIVFGHIFDKGLYKALHAPKHTADVRLVYFRTVFQTIGYIAKSDGVVSESEVQVARNIMLNDFKLDNRQMLMAINFFNEGKQANFDIIDALNTFKTVCGKYGDLRRFFLELVVKASLADKILRPPQRASLIFVCNILGIQLSELDYQLRIYGYVSGGSANPHTQQHYKQETNNRGYNSYNGSTTRTNIDPQLAAAYTLLGVQPTDNIKVIKKAYRQLMSKYHPDKLSSKGLPPEMLEIAKVKTQQVAAAYALIVRGRR